jgi:hypothetical protein
MNRSLQKTGELTQDNTEDNTSLNRAQPLNSTQQALEDRLKSTLNLIQLGIIDPKGMFR